MGTLYIIATPLGNLKDITERALETLRQVDLVACEDTRQTLKLLNHYNIQRPLVSYFQHSKVSKIEHIAQELTAGKAVGLVTDAGTPGISDPGGKLVEEILRLSPGVRIVPIPGPNAAIAALSVAGFPADKFIFLGFPPHKKGREKYFKEIAARERTIVFYESTHRILKTLEQLAQVAPERPIMVAREMTKMFESIYRGAAQEILETLKSDGNNLKGEFVVVVRGT